MQILLLNGPNLNLLGVREPEVYGKETFTDYFRQLKDKYPSVDISCFQSNVEGELIDKIHEVGFSYDGIILNAGAYTHTSIALADAIAAVKAPVVEVHISNTARREAFRHVSYVRSACVATIKGHGLTGYLEALRLLCGK